MHGPHRTLLPLCPLLCLLLGACPAPKERKAPAAEAPAAAKTATAPPSAAAPRSLGAPYDPSADPQNRGGFDFSRRADPADPAAARREPFTIEALYRLPTLSDPRFSPDGKTLLFVVTHHELRQGKSNSEIYRIGADGSDLRRMTRNPASDASPRWLPDGEAFVFVSTRKGGSQLWRMAIDGGEAEQLTTISTGVSEPVVSPAGDRVAFVSRVFPEFGADDEKNKALLDDIKESPIQAHLADELLHRHWSFYKGGRRNHVLLLHLQSGTITDATPGDFDSPAFSLGGGGLAFAPDGGELCVVSNREAASARAWTTNKDLFAVSIDAEGKPGPARNLTPQNRGADGHPLYAPDGSAIAYLRQKTPGYESDRLRLSLYQRKSGEVTVLGEGFDNWVLDMRWSADGRSLVFKGAEKGRFPLYRLDVQSGAVRKLAVPQVRGFDLAPDGRLAFVNTAVDRPMELFVADAEGKNARRITHFSREVAAEFDLRPAEELWIDGGEGQKVHTFVVKPHGFTPGKRYPLIINVHGGPQYQWSDAFRGDWQVYPGAGYVVAFFNPTGSIGYGQRYTAAISRDWGGAVYREVMAVTEALAKEPYVDPKRIGAMGWSYGGYMMNWLLGHTRRFKALASMMGVYELVSMYGATEELWFPEWDVGGTPWDKPEAYRRWSPAAYAKNFATPTLVITGEKDYRVPYTQSLQLFTTLRRRDVPARLIVLPNDGHWPSYAGSMPLYYAAHLDWFHRYLGGGKSPYDIQQMVRGRAFKGKK